MAERRRRPDLEERLLTRALAQALLAAAALVVAAQCASAAHPQVRVGGFPTGIALNPVTHTIYVGNGTSGTLSLIDGRACNASTARGCGQRVAAATAGVDPIGIAVDRTTNTVYVANVSGTVAVLNGRRCDAETTSGCRARPAVIRVGVRPQFLAVDETTHTVYVANMGSDTVSVIDGSACNADSTARCGRVRASIAVGPGPFALALNDRTSSLYVTTVLAPTVAIVDIAHCNARDVSGCRCRPTTVNVGDAPGGIAINTRTDTVYVTGQLSGDVSVVDGGSCNAARTSGCRRTPSRVRAGGGARGIAVNELTNTVYVANTEANTVSVIDGESCNAAVRRGCSRRPATAPVGLSPRRVAVDEVTNTIYVTNAGSNTVTMLNGRECNGRVHRGCARTTPIS